VLGIECFFLFLSYKMIAMQFDLTEEQLMIQQAAHDL